MQIILMEKVTNLGQLGEVVKVKNGYARNFLIPQGKAKRATAANMAEFEVRRAELEAADKAKLAEARAQIWHPKVISKMWHFYLMKAKTEGVI